MVANSPRVNVLHKKLWRDMGHSAMQFVAIVLLCALGTWVFSGLDSTWRILQLSAETYFEKANLADFWVNVVSASKADVDNLRNVEGVEAVQGRFTAEMDTPDFGDDVSLLVHAYHGAPQINIPVVRSGEALGASDLRGCLIDEQFAKARGLKVGDSVKLSLGGTDWTFAIRGTVLSAEQVVTTKDVMPDPEHYGYALINWDALDGMPINDVVVTLAPGADASAVEKRIQSLLPQALVLTQKTHASTQRTRSEVTLFSNLTLVFPGLAFAVAAMIVLTTLTRMIENQRTQIGTLKALGYSKAKIRSHYLYYAFVPSLLGALIGLFVGRYTLPDMLYKMETAHYILPQKIRPPISLTEWGMTALMVLLSVLICLYTYRRKHASRRPRYCGPNRPRRAAACCWKAGPRSGASSTSIPR